MPCELLPASRLMLLLWNLESPRAAKTLNDIISYCACIMLHGLHTYYAHFNAGIIRTSLSRAQKVGRDHGIATIDWHSKARKCGCKLNKWLYGQSCDKDSRHDGWAWFLTKLKMSAICKLNGLLWLLKPRYMAAIKKSKLHTHTHTHTHTPSKGLRLHIKPSKNYSLLG